ncbi:MAG: DMT family transporter [Vallitalea sp.]|jgi:transporter family-2 protein|nr:DMT family transporter [Vallitalea sp.]
MYIALALLTGALVIISISINGNLAKKVGVLQAALTNGIVGLICSILFYLIMNNLVFDISIDKFRNVQLYYLLGGFIGAIAVVLNNTLINKISAVYVTILVFVGQMTTGILIDYFKFHIFSSGKVIGGIIIIVGLLYYINGDKRAKELSHNSEL